MASSLELTGKSAINFQSIFSRPCRCSAFLSVDDRQSEFRILASVLPIGGRTRMRWYLISKIALD